ncbi:MAG TPA: hypothetical protein VM029_09365 [Opitutaceae bacterium]|nr:hypothetical protein [Opitutaceae bacterium]
MKLAAGLMIVRIGFLCFLASAAWLAAAPAAETVPDPATLPVVELPKFVVTDTRELPPPESWRYTRIAGLEVLSTVSETNTRRFVRDFQRLQEVIEIVWPAVTRGPPPVPGMLILCGGGNAFDTFMPARLRPAGHDAAGNDRGAGALAKAAGPAGAAARPTSIFLQESDRAAIVVDFVKDRFDDRAIPNASPLANVPLSAEPAEDGPTPGSSFLTENDPFREFYLQYFRSVIRRGGSEAPPWLEEGLVQVLASVQFSKEEIALGRLQDGAGGQRPDEFTVRLNRQPLMDLNRMFAAEPPAGGDVLTYSPQCYAFVHLCLYGKKGTYQPALQKLVRRAAAEPVTEKVFQECFGLSYDQMGVLLRSHITHGAHQYIQLRAAKGATLLAEPPVFTVRAATPAEIGRIKGETYRMGGHNDRARLALIAPYVRGEHDLALVAALGLHARATGDTERARKFLEAAAQAKVQRARVYLELARLRLAAAKTAAPKSSSVDDATVARIMPLLMLGVRIAPPMPEIFELIAEVRAQSVTPPTPAEITLVYEGAQRFPRRLRLIYLAAALAVRQGDRTEARTLIAHGLSLAGKNEPAQHFKALESQLQ